MMITKSHIEKKERSTFGYVLLGLLLMTLLIVPLAASPNVAIKKYTNGEYANNPPGPKIPVGNMVTWTYIVNNTGDVNLTSIVVTDDQGVTVDCSGTTTLAPGVSMTCTAQGVAMKGPYENTGCVYAEPESPPQVTPQAFISIGQVSSTSVSACDESHYVGTVNEPDITIKKYTNGVDTDEPLDLFIPVGIPVTWTYVIANTGNKLLNDITVIDNMTGPITCNETKVRKFDPGDTMTCNATGVATYGPYTNLVTVTGKFGNELYSNNDTSHYTGFNLSINVKKYVSSSGVPGSWDDANAAPGLAILVPGTVYWKTTVVNTGFVWVNLTSTDILDGSQSDILCGNFTGPIAPGEERSCIMSMPAEEGIHFNNVTTVASNNTYGPYIFIASDRAFYSGSIRQADLSITKQVAPSGEYVGKNVTWTVVVTNHGPQDASNVVVTDNTTGLVDSTILDPVPEFTSDHTWTMSTLGADQSATFTVVTNFTTPGSKTNEVSVYSDTYDPISTNNTASATATIWPLPSVVMNIGKTVSTDNETWGDSIVVPYGSDIWWRIVVSNGGNVPADLAVTDLLNNSLLDIHQCNEGLFPTTLAAGESFTCTIGPTEAQDGANTNYVNVTGCNATFSVCGTASDEATYTLPVEHPAIAIQKFTNGVPALYPPGPYIEVGDSVTWTYNTTNIGDTQLTNVTVTDDQGVSVDCGGRTTLNPGETMTCVANGTAQPGQYMNTGTAVGIPPYEYPDVTASDPSHYFGVDLGLEVMKTISNTSSSGPWYVAETPESALVVAIESDIWWNITVKNTGNAGVSLLGYDDYNGAALRLSDLCSNFPSFLAPGEQDTCITVDIARAGIVYNTVRVEAANHSVTTNASSSAYYDGGFYLPTTLNFTKTAQDVDGFPLYVGDLIRYTLKVNTTGAHTAFNVTVFDDLPDNVTCVSVTGDRSNDGCADPVVWHIGDLSSGAAAFLTIDVRVNTDAVGQSIINTGNASAANAPTIPPEPPYVCPDGKVPVEGQCDSPPVTPPPPPTPTPTLPPSPPSGPSESTHYSVYVSPPHRTRECDFVENGTLSVLPNGQVLDPVTICARDGIGKLVIGQNTIALTEGGAPLGFASIIPIATVGQGVDTGAIAPIGIAYDLLPVGGTFKPPTTITLTFTAEKWAEFNGKNLVLGIWNSETGMWEELETVVTPATRTVTAQVTRLGTIGLLEKGIPAPVTQVPTPTPIQSTESTTPSVFPFPLLALLLIALLLILIAWRRRRKEEEGIPEPGRPRPGGVYVADASFVATKETAFASIINVLNDVDAQLRDLEATMSKGSVFTTQDATAIVDKFFYTTQVAEERMKNPDVRKFLTAEQLDQLTTQLSNAVAKMTTLSRQSVPLINALQAKYAGATT